MSITINSNIFLVCILFLFTNQASIYGMTMICAFLHECGHWCIGRMLGFIPIKFKILPLGFSIEFKTKIEDYNIKVGKSNKTTVKKIVTDIAGPFVNLILLLIRNCFAIRFFCNL